MQQLIDRNATMTTTLDLYDICSLYFVQAACQYEHLGDYSAEQRNKYLRRMLMYVIASEMIIGGNY